MDFIQVSNTEVQHIGDIGHDYLLINRDIPDAYRQHGLEYAEFREILYMLSGAWVSLRTDVVEGVYRGLRSSKENQVCIVDILLM